MPRSLMFSVALVFLTSIVGFGSDNKSQTSRTNNVCCSLVSQALADYSKLRVGSTKADVERAFAEGSGASFGDEEVYVYRRCHLIKLLVSYSPGKNGGTPIV